MTTSMETWEQTLRRERHARYAHYFEEARQLPNYVRKAAVLHENFLGSGSYGSVYKLSSKRVVKLTFDTTEIKTAIWQLKNNHPLLVKVHKVFQFDDECAFIVREVADDFTSEFSWTYWSNACLDAGFRDVDLAKANVGVVKRGNKRIPVVRDLGAVRRY